MTSNSYKFNTIPKEMTTALENEAHLEIHENTEVMTPSEIEIAKLLSIIENLKNKLHEAEERATKIEDQATALHKKTLPLLSKLSKRHPESKKAFIVINRHLKDLASSSREKS